MVARLIAQPELMRLGGEAREVTLMFTDLASFTTLSEQLTAEQTVEVLTGYFNAMTPIVHASGGTVDKFIGDAVMAFWARRWTTRTTPSTPCAPPLPCSRPCSRWWPTSPRAGCRPSTCALACTRAAWWVGNVGSAQRFSYTAIGDAVNPAARLEGANKAFGTGILLSAATAAQLPASTACCVRWTM